MAGISPTIGSAQHPMIRRRRRLAEVRMYALDGLTLLPFPRLPATPTLSQGCIADTGRGVWPFAVDRPFLGPSSFPVKLEIYTREFYLRNVTFLSLLFRNFSFYFVTFGRLDF